MIVLIGEFGLYRPHELGDGQDIVADDLEVGPLLDCGDHNTRVDLAVGNAAGQHVAQRSAAASRRDDPGDVDAFLLEVSLLERNGEWHAIGGNAEVADRDLRCPSRL